MISFCKLRWWRLAMPFNRSWSAGEMLLIVMEGISRVPICNRNARITIDSRSVNADLRRAGRCEYLNRRRATADGCRASTSVRDSARREPSRERGCKRLSPARATTRHGNPPRPRSARSSTWPRPARRKSADAELRDSEPAVRRGVSLHASADASCCFPLRYGIKSTCRQGHALHRCRLGAGRASARRCTRRADLRRSTADLWHRANGVLASWRRRRKGVPIPRLFRSG